MKANQVIREKIALQIFGKETSARITPLGDNEYLVQWGRDDKEIGSSVCEGQELAIQSSLEYLRTQP